jgi:Domain of unknown function (DUF3560)
MECVIFKPSVRPLCVLLLKSYIRAHTRTLPNGRTITVHPYFNKRIPKGEGPKKGRTPKGEPPPKGVYQALRPEHLSARLLRHVEEGKLTHADAHANLEHLARRAHAGHHLEHGQGPSWTPEQTHAFIAHARGKLHEHETAQKRQRDEAEQRKQDEERQQAEADVKAFDAIERDLQIEERKTDATQRDTERVTQSTEQEDDTEDEQIQGAVLITGNTYPVRRELRGLGAVWSEQEKGYLIHSGNNESIDAAKLLAERVKGQHKLTFDTTDVPASAFERLSGEDLRAYRQQKLTRKITLWRDQAARLDKQAESIDARLKPYDDYAFWTEPVKIGHHSEHRHRNLRRRLQDLMDKKARMSLDARDLRERADRLERQGATVQGDAAKRRQQQREVREQAGVSIGSRIQSPFYGHGTVMKVNKNTYTVRFDTGHTSTEDKSHIVPLGETVDVEALRQQTKPKFKKGAQVRFNYLGRDREGVITGVGPHRYTIQSSAGKVAVDHARVWVLEETTNP